MWSTIESTAAGSAVDLSVVDDPDRLVALKGVHNFRDLGGYVMADGRVIGLADALAS